MVVAEKDSCSLSAGQQKDGRAIVILVKFHRYVVPCTYCWSDDVRAITLAILARVAYESAVATEPCRVSKILFHLQSVG